MKFTKERRQTLIDAINVIEAEDARLVAAAPGAWTRAREQLQKQREPFADAILAEMPMLPMSRCPFCGFVAEQTFDPHGIDGLWWRGPGATREIHAPPRCPHYFCFTGAVALARPLDVLPFGVSLGPEVPFVVPSILKHPGMRVVISSTPIGRHTGYPIFYYGDPIIPETAGLNDWGHHLWTYYEDGQPRGSRGRLLFDEECDYDLAPWVAQGKVRYVLPGDETMTLRTGVDGCPYLDLPGRRRLNRLHNGVLYPREGDASAALVEPEPDPIYDGAAVVDAAIARDDVAYLRTAIRASSDEERDLAVATRHCVALSTHPDEHVRGHAIRGFGRIARHFEQLDPASIAIVEAARHDASAYVRKLADEAAGEIEYFLTLSDRPVDTVNDESW